MPSAAKEQTPSEPTWEMVLKRNLIERHKHSKAPLSIRQELPALIDKGYEAIPEEDMVLLSWWGLMHDKPKVGTFMVRVKLPGGRVLPSQLEVLARISKSRGRNYAEITTRQGIQLHWVRLEELPEVLDDLESCGLTTAGGEGDTVRNVTSCPVAGLDPEEHFDVAPLVAKVSAYFSGNPAYSNLPRKHKYSISACFRQCNAPEIHDVALVGTMRGDEPGFALRLGGGLSATPRLSKDLGVFVPASPHEEVIEVLRAITDTWQEDLRYRMSRVKARIKFMVDDYGVEAIRAAVEHRLGRSLADGEAPAPTRVGDHLGWHVQKQAGLGYLGVPVPMGQLSGDQLQALADLLGPLGAEARFTRAQNLIVTGIPEQARDKVTDALAEINLHSQRSRLWARAVACTDHRFCNYSVAETKGKLAQIVPALEQRFGRGPVERLRLHMDGCPHSCAHHWIADIGLQGTTATDPETGARGPAYNLRLRGRLGSQAAIGVPLIRRIPEKEVAQVVTRLVGAWLDQRQAEGDHLGFGDFVDQNTDEELRSIAAGTDAPRDGEGAQADRRTLDGRATD